MVSEIFHWVEERSCDDWAKKHLEKCLRDEFSEILDFEKIEFDGSANLSRKYGKIICLFNFDAQLINCHWQDDKYGDPAYVFNVYIPNLSSFDYDVEVELHHYPGSLPETCQEDVNSRCVKALSSFIDYFKNIYAKDIIEKMQKFSDKNSHKTSGAMYEDLTKKTAESEIKKDNNIDRNENHINNEKYDDQNQNNQSKQNNLNNESKLDINGKLNFTINESFTNSIEMLYNLFSKSESLSALTKSRCDFDLTENAKFFWLDGQIEGKCLKFENKKFIYMEFRFVSWPSSYHDCKVLVEFEEQSEHFIKVTIKQYNIPDESEQEMVKSFWNSVFFDNIKRMCGPVL